jgi:hypothetical protein
LTWTSPNRVGLKSSATWFWWFWLLTSDSL